MKVFISSSGTRSEAVAEGLSVWLPDVIQSVETFTSAGIEKGARWSADIAAHLQEARVGIICLTHDNLDAPWVLFEAGALSKTIESTFVCPYLLDIEPTDLQGPLIQFQATKANREDTKKLVHTINRALGDIALPEIRLNKAFDLLWPELERLLRDISKAEHSNKQGRSETEMIREILDLVRAQTRGDIEPPWLAALLSDRDVEKFERMKNKYRSLAFKKLSQIIDILASEANAVRINLMRGAQHNVYAVSRVEPYLPLQMDSQDSLNYFQANKEALDRIKHNHPVDSQEYAIHRIFVVSREVLEDMDRAQRLKSIVELHSNAGFDVRVVLQEELESPLTYEFVIYDDEVALRLNVNYLERRYGEATVYFDDAIVSGVYKTTYMEIEAESYRPEEFWRRYPIKPRSQT